MRRYYLGVDVSKGHADFQLINDAGTRLPMIAEAFDTRSGHEDIYKALAAHAKRKKRKEDLVFIVGVESTGGLERNWIKFFKDLNDRGLNVKVYRLNPLAISRFLDRRLHKSKTDRISALGIATYLKEGLRAEDKIAVNPELSGELMLYRTVESFIKENGKLKTNLKTKLISVHPELVQYCRDNKMPNWVLLLLERYPTVEDLANAKEEDLLTIPYIKKERVHKLIENAKHSVASQRDQSTGEAMKLLIEQISTTGKRIEKAKKDLIEKMKDNKDIKIMCSIPGISYWSAIGLLFEFGPIEKFPNKEALIAYAGLDPVVRISGDGEKHVGISHRGKSNIRYILFNIAKSAINYNPVIRRFYQHLLKKGKLPMVALVACMRKILVLIYACLVKEESFSPVFYFAITKQYEEKAQALKRKTIAGKLEKICFSAPISRKELKRRLSKLQEKKAASHPG